MVLPSSWGFCIRPCPDQVSVKVPEQTRGITGSETPASESVQHNLQPRVTTTKAVAARRTGSGRSRISTPGQDTIRRVLSSGLQNYLQPRQAEPGR